MNPVYLRTCILNFKLIQGPWEIFKTFQNHLALKHPKPHQRYVDLRDEHKVGTDLTKIKSGKMLSFQLSTLVVS